MLQPNRLKHRKVQKGRNTGIATRGTKVSFGEYGLKAVARGRLTSRQIEAARIALTRHMKRGGRVWIKIFPYKPVTKKPLEVRMGAGKGGVEFYVAPVRSGRILYEIGAEVDTQTATEALALAAAKLPIRTRVIAKSDVPWG